MASSSQDGSDRKPLLDFGEENKDDEASSQPNSLQAGDVDIQEWERRLVTGDLPDDFLQVTEPTASVTSWSEKSKKKSSHDDDADDVAHLGATLAAASTTAAATAASGMASTTTPSGTSSTGALQRPGAGADRFASETSNAKHPKSTEESDRELALALQKQLDMEAAEGEIPVPPHMAGGMPGVVMAAPANVLGRLTVTVAEAKLAKNYGMARMDPYCRIRIGHCVYETPTCPNGAREPKWNKTFNCFLLQGVKHIDVEIYDECTFSNDAMVAHGNFIIPDEVVHHGIVVDEWWPLSGQEGHDKEGMIHLILSLQPLRTDGFGLPGTGPQGQQQRQPVPELTEEQLLDFSKMFPNIEKDIIKSVFVEKRGNLEETATCLLQLCQP